jgi:hypothetical protein
MTFCYKVVLFLVPSPPRDVSVKILNYTSTVVNVEVNWSQPIKPSGEIQLYTVYIEPPFPPSKHTFGGKLRKGVISIALLDKGVEYKIRVSTI